MATKQELWRCKAEAKVQIILGVVWTWRDTKQVAVAAQPLRFCFSSSTSASFFIAVCRRNKSGLRNCAAAIYDNGRTGLMNPTFFLIQDLASHRFGRAATAFKFQLSKLTGIPPFIYADNYTTALVGGTRGTHLSHCSYSIEITVFLTATSWRHPPSSRSRTSRLCECCV